MATGDYTPREIDGVMCVWLQGIGWHGAKRLSDIKIGDALAYNYGSTAIVKDVTRSRSGASIILVVKPERSGTEYTTAARRAGTFVAVKGVK